MLKAIGYLISTFSVALLGAVSWSSTDGDPTMRLLLLAGMASSVAGMGLRLASHLKEKARRRQDQAAPAVSTAPTTAIRSTSR